MFHPSDESAHKMKCRPAGGLLARAMVLLFFLLLAPPADAQANQHWTESPSPAQDLPPAAFLPLTRRPGGPLATLASPDGSVTVTVETTDLSTQTGQLRFSISHGAQPLVTNGQLGVTAARIDDQGATWPMFTDTTEYGWEGNSLRSVREEYTLAVSERSPIPNNFNEVTIQLKANDAPAWRLNLIVRAYDEGVAFRYVVPAQPGVSRVRYTADGTRFLFPWGTDAYEQRPIPFTEWSEGTYTRVAMSQLSAQLPLPLTLAYANGEYGAILEGAVDNFARASLERISGSTPGVAIKLGGDSESLLPYATPWRVLMVAPTAGGLVERNYLLYNLAPPTRYTAASVATFAAMPGTAMRVMPYTTKTLPDGSLLGLFSTEESNKVVDFAAAHGIDYIMFDTGWYGPEFAPGADPSVEYGSLSIQNVAAYGASKGVGVILYVNQTQLAAYVDKILGKYQSWGVKGIKLGFVDGSSQQGLNLVHYTVREAARYGIFVDIHDAYRPSGMTRTYPNLFTQEGVAGAEHNLGADHTTMLPFTRYIIGAADYTLPYYWANLATTRGHQLGLAIIFYSPLNFVFWYDSPWQYDQEPQPEAVGFLGSVPTTWDETLFLASNPGASTSVARRKGNEWYVGTITNTQARTVSIALDFLEPDTTYTARIYHEAATNQITVEERQVVQGDVVEAAMLASGEHAIKLIPLP